MKRFKYVLQLSSLLIVLTFFYSCEKEAKGTDKLIFDASKKTEGFVWYKFSDELLEKSIGSGHSQPFLRTRYNEIASDMLDSSGKVLVDAKFPEGSLIVKELYDDIYTLTRYAILYKESDNKNADNNGWVWGYINTDGTVAEPSSNKGAACFNCHSQPGNIDYMLMNSYFP